MSSDNHMSQHDPDYFDDDEPRDQWCRDFEGHKALHEFCVDHQAAAAFIAHYRKNGGCSHCGGIPHTTTCYVGRMEAALQQAQVPAPAWQPIETAPKDGTRVLVSGDGVMSVALWHLGPEVCGYIRPGEYGWRSGRDTFLNPTHWMPLPAAPWVAEDIRCVVTELREGEENDGPLGSTDLFLTGRGISLLVNVKAPGVGTYSFLVDGKHKKSGYVGAPPVEGSAVKETGDIFNERRDIKANLPAGFVDGVLYCYGGCGRRYEDFGLDNSLPTPLWNQIAVGLPFDETQEGIEREGRGGVLCAQCVIDRLAKLPGVTVAFVTVDGTPDPGSPATGEAPAMKVQGLEQAIEQRDELLELVRAILQSTREDEKGEQWTIRAFLEQRGVYDGNLSGSRRLVAEACRNVLASITPADPGVAAPPEHQG